MATKPPVPPFWIPDRRMDEPVRCTFRVHGALDPSCSDDFGGLRVAVRAGACGPESELTGNLPDQAAVLGVLNGLYALGRPLLFVSCVAAPSGGFRKEAGT